MATPGWRIGAFEVHLVSDGTTEVPTSFFAGAVAEPESAAALQRAAGLAPGAPLPVPVNGFAVRRPDGRIVLLDAGTGQWRGDRLGHLPANLRDLGIAPAEVDTVLMTHLHGDHAGGLLEPSGAPVFPAARILVPEAEIAFWTDPGRTAALPPVLGPTVALMRQVLEALGRRVEAFRPGEEPVAGLRPVPLPGHTPGHTGYRLGEGAESLFVWADIVHVAAFQFARPDWAIAFDADAAEAAATRRRVMAALAESGEVIAGMHLPARGRVERAGEAFRFAPLPNG